KMLRGLQHVSWWDRSNIIRFGSMLSAMTTHTAQAASNSLNLGLGMVNHPLAVGADMARHQIGKLIPGLAGERPRYMSEWGQMKNNLLPGLMAGGRDAAEILRSGLNPTEVAHNWEAGTRPGFDIEGTRLGSRLSQRQANVANALIESPLRLLGAGDALIRGAARGAFAGGIAERQAIREGYAAGASRQARVNEILRNLEDYPELMQEVE